MFDVAFKQLKLIPGKGMIFSDHLSYNVSADKSKDSTCRGVDMKIHDVYLNASSEKCMSLATKTSKHPVLVLLKHDYKRLTKTKR